MYILGLSAYYHDSAAVLLKNDHIIAAAQEERFTRKKQDSNFPSLAVAYCLQEAGIAVQDIDHIVFYDKPFLKFERLIETYLAEAPKGFKSFMSAVPVWLKEKLFLKKLIADEILKLTSGLKRKDVLEKLMFCEHHLSHAGSAYFPSPFNDAAILTIDGVGEWTTTSLAHGKGNKLDILKELRFPHSLGLLYSAFTYYTGFKVNSGEYKIMGLAPYGEPKYVKKIKEHLIDIKEDGSFRLNMDYFNYTTGLTMTSEKFSALFDGPVRKQESALTQKEMDLARSIQEVTQEIMVKLAKHAKEVTGSENLCMAGGVALNCVGNGVILREKIFKNIWTQPAAGDAGGALGAALSFYHLECGHDRQVSSHNESQGVDMMQGAYLGPSFSENKIQEYLDSVNAVYTKCNSDDEMYEQVSQALANEQVVGWNQGRMEFGPRALGARSILGDPRSKKMQSIMNLKIKYRESFRPFAPSVLREDVSDYFEILTDSPYMLLVADVVEGIRVKMTDEQKKLFGIDKLNVPKSSIPAVTHVDYSARVQTVHKETNPKYWNVINRFKEKTGCSVVVNTSFNVRGEPIVCTPEDSYRCFMRTEMDILAIGNFILDKSKQPQFEDKSDWTTEFELD